MNPLSLLAKAVRFEALFRLLYYSSTFVPSFFSLPTCLAARATLTHTLNVWVKLFYYFSNLFFIKKLDFKSFVDSKSRKKTTPLKSG
jgi:hypothetical protein